MRRRLKSSVLFLVGLGLALGTIPSHNAGATVPGTNVLVSVNNTGDGQGGNGSSPAVTGNPGSTNAEISANGRFVVFTSYANNLVAGDTNGFQDIFVRDLVNGTTTRVNISTSGAQANDVPGYSTEDYVAISSTGRYIIFPSRASNLIDGQVTPVGQLYIRDTVANTTNVVSQKNDGTFSAKGIDAVGGVSSDGRFVSWKARLDTNFVSTTETNTFSDYVYFADLKDRSFRVLNSAPSSGQYFVSGITMSCDGAFIAFASKVAHISSDTDATEDVYLVDVRNGSVLSGVTTGVNNGRSSLLPSLSCNGEYLVFRSDDWGFSSLVASGGGTDHQYLYNRIDNSISIVDTTTSGVLANSGSPGRSGVDDSGNVVFNSAASNLASVPNGQVYLKHRDTGLVELVSKNASGVYSNGAGNSLSISANGKMTTYAVGATATTLLSSDTNGYVDTIASSTGL